MKRYQWVWWFPDWEGIGFARLDPEITNMAYIYDWYLWLGFVELRKWTTRKLPA